MILVVMLMLAQMPTFSNAKMETRSGTNLKAAFQTILAERSSPGWVAYTVPATPGQSGWCEWGSKKVMLEGSRTAIMLYRLTNHAVEKVRPISGECEIDAGGLPLTWLNDVKAADSAALLETMIDARGDSALAAISMHADPASENLMLKMASSGNPVRVREKALFWLSQKAGQRAVGAIVHAIDNDPEVEVKKKAVFALSQLPKDEGVPKLIDVAKNNKTPEVRKQAFFWLGQSKDPRATAFFREVLGK
jgi:hypothetical protein